ncbi:hypothetical protein StoSoilB3_36470 [Arthrobacter sp. StoSoilB3]|nr:hypothetical protein StoSoilB3_36470 [Arthrobacter sp. StoSoilB3]
MERRKPEFSELLMVKIAPAPGVKLMRVPALTRASQSENCTISAYAGAAGGRDAYRDDHLCRTCDSGRQPGAGGHCPRLGDVVPEPAGNING